jgi:AcrR family transcriptional regulator
VPRPKGARDADYEDKRRALLARMTARLMRREVARPSLRQLAEAAGVTVPTLKHYFGSRSEIVEAILEEYLRHGHERLKRVAAAELPFAESMREFAHGLIHGMSAQREVRLGDVFAVSLAEGLLDPDLGPAALKHIVDPSVDALAERLRQHTARGEMIATDVNAAALMLLSPILIAVLHQDQLCGARHRPVELARLADEVSAAFVRAYAVHPASAAARSATVAT